MADFTVLAIQTLVVVPSVFDDSRGRKFTRLSVGDDSWLVADTSRSGRAETSREKRSWQSCSDLTLKVEGLDDWPGLVAGKTLGVAMAGILSLLLFGVAVVFRVINARLQSLANSL